MNVELNHQLDDIARSYVKLVLAVGLHDPNYVDAYYGPESWREECQQQSLATLNLDVRNLLTCLDGLKLEGLEIEQRREFLIKQLASVEYYIKHLSLIHI